MAAGGGVSAGTAVKSILSVAAVLAFAFTVGRRLVPATIRLVDNRIGGDTVKLTTLMVMALGFGSLTQALHLEAVLGAFIVGILMGEVKRFDHHVRHSFEQLTLAVFAPVFFATAGLRVDLGALWDPKVLAVALVVLVVAIFGKFAGAYVGARLSRLGHWEALSLGAGMNARGALEIIVATIGLSLGVLTSEMYSIIVVMAIVTSLMAPPLLRWTLGKVEMGDEERERLEAEERHRGSFVGNLKRVLLPAAGRPSSRLAARLVDGLVAGQDVEVTTMYVRRAGDGAEEEAEDALGQIERHLDLPKSHLRRVVRDGAEDDGFGSVVLDESSQGYDLLVVGTTGERRREDGQMFGGVVDDLVQEATCPVLVVRAASKDADSGDGDDPAERAESRPLRRLLLPVEGGELDRAAAEVAFSLAGDDEAIVDVVHVVRGGELQSRISDEETTRSAMQGGQELVDKIAELGHHLGATVHTQVIVADHEEEALVARARSGVDLIVLAASRAPVTQRAFFGHHIDHVLRHAPCPVVVVSAP
ncbi:MAG: universal stress protein, partial [Actinomycetota bacterium]|nr:universal stress protein [Actinomycetota bacterium]